VTTYENNKVKKSEVESRRKAISRAPREQKLGKFFAYRTAGALARDQTAGYHWGYLAGEGKVHCTCGLVSDTTNLEAPPKAVPPEVELKLHPLLLIRGHRNLPSFDGVATALIVSLTLSNAGKTTHSTAFCQLCGSVIQNVSIDAATTFVDCHNNSCKDNQEFVE